MKPPSGQPDDIPAEDFVGCFSMDERTLKPNGILTVWLSCVPKKIGIFTSIVNIEVGDDQIERVVFLLAEDQVSEDLKPVRGRKNVAMKPVINRLNNMYKMPIERKDVPGVVLQGLTQRNYALYFKTLLNMEELCMEEDMKAYDMEGVTMRRREPYLVGLEVCGLAERRPSLVFGDAVYVRLVNDDSAKPYEGYICHIEADQVLLQFADTFHKKHRDENLYTVHCFGYNRVNYRRLYQAVESAAKSLHTRFLFPSEHDGKRSITAKFTEPISSLLNEEQANAVQLILGCRGGAPYVIHGPPGTGKTKTLIEAILQLYKTRQQSRILVCASSNCAADLLLEKILCEGVKLKENEIFRLNATSRSFEEINPDLLRFCLHEGTFRCPSLEQLCRYRIIITTYMSAASLYAKGVKHGHFSHLILDEAGQASEPETMVPISNLCGYNTVTVLAGDPMQQLGPVIQCSVAKSYGLGKSYLERLLESNFYESKDQNYVTMLVKNYRSHPEILSIPSTLLYQDLLIPSRRGIEASCLPWADMLPNSEFPVMFFGIQGLDEREGSSPSWFNRIEASKVVELIKKLTSRKVDEHDIGVITPYRQQVIKIRKALESVNMPGIKVGSVEQFQGQEREVIIISTVRSTAKHDEFDKTFCLGFNRKRFNVAITRARSLLIIIGNPHIIAKEHYWDQMLSHCAANKSYQGCALPGGSI